MEGNASAPELNLLCHVRTASWSPEHGVCEVKKIRSVSHFSRLQLLQVKLVI